MSSQASNQTADSFIHSLVMDHQIHVYSGGWSSGSCISAQLLYFLSQTDLSHGQSAPRLNPPYDAETYEMF